MTVPPAMAPQFEVGTGFGYAKLILVGDHWVLDGAAALAVALPQWRTVVSVRPAAVGSGVLVDTPDADLSTDQRLQTLAMARLACQQAQVGDAQVSVTSTVPIRRRLGSSAAFAVALVRALADGKGEDLSDTTLVTRARALEALVHGQSSGLDPAAASVGPGAVLFQNGMVVRRITSIGPGLAAARWVLADIGQGVPTAHAVRHALAQRTNLAAQDRNLWLARVTSAAQAAGRALEQGNLDHLALALNAAAASLVPLDIASESMQLALQAMQRAGAAAVKPTGAGMGGCLLALAPNVTTALAVAEACGGLSKSIHVLAVRPAEL